MPPVMPATSWDILLHNVIQGGVIQTRKRCKHGKDNLTLGMQIVSMVTVFIVRNLAIKSLSAENMEKY